MRKRKKGRVWLPARPGAIGREKGQWIVEKRKVRKVRKGRRGGR